MSTDLTELEEKAMLLPPQQRAELAERLIASLDRLDDAEYERLWIEEAARRYEEYQKGNISSRSAEEVFRNARNEIR
ncbi:MAG: addiction module protein [Phycisphaerae bacterium]|nr:addiction module protein [Phycisphaerae bacterium]